MVVVAGARLHRIAIVAVLIAGCRIGPKTDSTSGGAAPGTLGTAAPGQFSDLAPGDTAGVIAMMRQTMRSIDAGLDSMIRRDTTLASGGDSTAHHLTVWLQEGVPRKLVIVDSTGHGQNNTETAAWFMGGDLAVLVQVTDAYAFDGDRIVLWTDDAMQPRADAAADVTMVRQAALVESVRAWLAVFGNK